MLYLGLQNRKFKGISMISVKFFSIKKVVCQMTDDLFSYWKYFVMLCLIVAGGRSF